MKNLISIWMWAALLPLVGCYGPVVETQNKNGYQLELIFEVKEHEIYRFQDGGHAHYIVIPNGSISSTQKDGDSVRIETIQTQGKIK